MDCDEVEEEPGTDAAAPLDLLLADAASSPLRRFLPGMSGVRFTAGLVRPPARVVPPAGGPPPPRSRRTPRGRPGRRAGPDRRRTLRGRGRREGPPVLLRGGLDQE